jgi:hypothetical protein
MGGTYQGAGVHFTLSNTSDVDINTDVEGSGTFLSISGYSNGIRSTSSISFNGTEVSGSCAIDCRIWDETPNGTTFSKSLTSGQINLNNQGAAATSLFLSGGTATSSIGVGRTGIDALFGQAATNGDYYGSVQAGDAVIDVLGAHCLWILPQQGAADYAQFCGTGVTFFGQGALAAGTLVLKPTTNTDAFDINNSAGTNILDVTPNATPANGLVQINNGASLIGYTGSFTGQTYRLDANAGSLTDKGDFINPTSDGSVLQIKNAVGTIVLTETTAATAGSSNLNVVGSVTTQATTYSALPASPAAGARSFITDDNAACTFGTAASGGGSTKCPVVYNGTAWVAG